MKMLARRSQPKTEAPGRRCRAEIRTAWPEPAPCVPCQRYCRHSAAGWQESDLVKRRLYRCRHAKSLPDRAWC